MSHSPTHLFRAALATLLFPAIANAATITGVVRNEAGTGIANVDIDLIDACSGDNVFLASDHTAADGTFSIVIANGTYDMHFIAPTAAAVVAGDVQDVVISANANLGTFTLHPGVLVSGTLKTPANAAAAGVDLKFVDLAKHERVFITKDVTSATGTWSARVPSGSYDIDFRPPVGSAFADGERLNLVVGATDVSGLTDFLRTGFAMTGTVRDKHNNKLKGVDVTVVDECTGFTVPTSHDNTDVNGNYSVVVPAGTYAFHYNPPQCLAVEASRTGGVIVDRAKSLGTEQLRDAVTLSGSVLDDAGQPLPDVQLKFYDATTLGSPRQATTHDHTNAAGQYAIHLPPGTYDVIVEPPAGKNDLTMKLPSVGVGFSFLMGTLQLEAGVPIHGHLTKPGGGPAVNVNINVVESTTRAGQLLSHDSSNRDGDFTVVVPAGTYDIEYDPTACSGLAPAAQPLQNAANGITLAPVALVNGVHALGTTLDPGGLPVPNVDLDFYIAGTTNKIYTPNDQTSATGTYDVTIPPGSYDVKYVPSSLTRLRPAAFASQPFAGTVTLPTLTLANGWFVSGTVRDTATGITLSGVTLEFFAPGGLTPLWTPHHLTNALGAYNVPVDAGVWDIRFTPPAGSGLDPAWRMAVDVSADTLLPDVSLHVPTLAVPAPASAQVHFAIWPNPAHGAMHFAIGALGGDADVTAWDVSGRKVATLFHGRADAPQTLAWSGTSDNGAALPAGIYLVRLAGPRGLVRMQRVAILH